MGKTKDPSIEKEEVELNNKVGYIRVSTDDQSLDRQRKTMTDNKVYKVFAEKYTGKTAERPELKLLLEYIREGDTLYIDSMSRLARNSRDFVNICDDLLHRGINIVSIKENLDTGTQTGRFIATILAAMAQIERENMLEYQKEGVRAARERGVKFGTPIKKMPNNFQKIYDQYKEGTFTSTQARALLGVSRATFFRIVKEIESGSPEFSKRLK